MAETVNSVIHVKLCMGTQWLSYPFITITKIHLGLSLSRPCQGKV